MQPLDSYGPIRIVPRADGGNEIRMLSTPAFTPLPEVKTWTARTAHNMHERMQQFLSSNFGLVIADVLVDGMARQRGQIARPEFRDIILEQLRLPFTADGMTILATESFAQMMRAAALSAPENLIQLHELIFRQGFIYFEQEQVFSDLIDVFEPVRAISWGVSAEAEDSARQMLHIFVWCEGRHRKHEWDNLAPNLGAPREINYAMHVCGFSFLPLNLEQDPKLIQRQAERHGPMVGLVRAIAAIAASPATTNESVDPRSKSERKKSARKQQAPRNSDRLRVLSLRHPEHGTYELDAATGRKMRAHWVRGHWRSQWYPSLEEHHTIWIDGFVKGDADLGTASGPKIYVGR